LTCQSACWMNFCFFVGLGVGFLFLFPARTGSLSCNFLGHYTSCRLVISMFTKK
jgi:hypothetical protein